MIAAAGCRKKVRSQYGNTRDARCGGIRTAAARHPGRADPGEIRRISAARWEAFPAWRAVNADNYADTEGRCRRCGAGTGSGGITRCDSYCDCDCDCDCSFGFGFGCGEGAARAVPLPAHSQHIDWHDCTLGPDDTAGRKLDAAGARCAYLTVPLDYTDPGGRTITVALSATPAPSTPEPNEYTTSGPTPA